MSKKITRRARGTGAIFFDAARDRWIGRVQVGRRADGSPLYVQRSAPTQGALLKLLDKARPPGPETTVAEWAGRWLAGLQIRTSSKRQYAHSINYRIVPTLGSIKVAALTAHQINEAIPKWELAPSSAKVTLGHLRTCLRAACLAGLRHDNPGSLARSPRVGRTRIDPFSPVELSRIIGAAGEQEETWIISLLAGVGCRLGEAIALLRSDLVGSQLSITKQYDRDGVREPKTENGIRTITVPAPVLAILSRVKGKGRLFNSAIGTHYSRNALYHRWTALLARLGLSYRNPHQLRHSVATALISAGEPVGDVARYLGDTVLTIVNTYLHATGSDPGVTLSRLLGDGKVAGVSGIAGKPTDSKS